MGEGEYRQWHLQTLAMAANEAAKRWAGQRTKKKKNIKKGRRFGRGHQRWLGGRSSSILGVQQDDMLCWNIIQKAFHVKVSFCFPGSRTKVLLLPVQPIKPSGAWAHSQHSLVYWVLWRSTIPGESVQHGPSVDTGINTNDGS